MKNTIYVLSAILIAILVTTWYSCEQDPAETCEQDEYCEIPVTVCCTTPDDCVYKYNGKEYPDTEEGTNELAIDMGCGAIIIDPDTGEQEKDLSDVITGLKALLARVQERSKSIR